MFVHWLEHLGANRPSIRTNTDGQLLKDTHILFSTHSLTGVGVIRKNSASLWSHKAPSANKFTAPAVIESLFSAYSTELQLSSAFSTPLISLHETQAWHLYDPGTRKLNTQSHSAVHLHLKKHLNCRVILLQAKSFKIIILSWSSLCSWKPHEVLARTCKYIVPIKILFQAQSV